MKNFQQYRIQFNRLDMQWNFARFGLSQQQQVAHQACQAVYFSLNTGQRIFIHLVDMAHQPHIPLNDGQWGTQFVADIGQKAPLSRKEKLETRQCLVEGAHQAPDLVLLGRIRQGDTS